MHIPDKYRDRYDNLARSHPWMREMRDEPTETIEPVEKLRDWSKWLNCVYATDDGKAYCVYNYKPYDGMKSCGEYMRDLADAIDDMIDRDYVLRRIFDAVCANRDELKAKLGEPTNVTSGETNVNPDGSPLVEGDAAAILRKAAKGFAGGDGRAMGNVAQLIGMDCHAVSDSEILRALAGMVERDYVSRQDFEAQHRTLCAVREQRDEAREQVDELTVRAVAAETEAEELKAIVDRLKAENAELRDECADCAVKRANRVLSQSVDRLTKERDALAADLADAMAPHAVDMRVKLDDGAPLPRHAKPGDAGLDLTSRKTVNVRPGETQMVGTGVRAEIPDGHFGLIAPRSGLASKHGITLANTPSVIDSGYRGEIMLALHNIGNTLYTVHRDERVAQMVVVPFAVQECVEADELSATERGEGGFGSTNRF